MEPLLDQAYLGSSAGTLCLDLSNTWGGRPDPAEDKLTSYESLVTWAAQVEPVDHKAAAALRELKRQHPSRVDRAFRDAMQLREVVYRLFSGIAAGRKVEDQDLQILNRVLHSALPHLRIAPISSQDGRAEAIGTRSYCWRWHGLQGDPGSILWPVALSAAGLLTSDRLDRVRECAGEGCTWLFIDTSRNGRRRWCDMSTCGNRAKARRHYHRRKARAG